MALVALVMLASSAGVMLFIGRAPGWERARVMVAVALTAVLYAAVDFWFYQSPDDLALRARLVQVNMLLASLHAAAWFRFAFSDAQGRVSSMPVWTRWAAATPFVVMAVGVVSGLLLDRSRVQRVEVPRLHVSEAVYPLSVVGNAAATILLLAFILLVAVHIRRAWRGDRAAVGIALGLALIVAAVIEEALVASGIVEFVYLATPGYALAVLPLTVQLLRRLGDDSRRLAELSTQLATEIEVRTVERDEARESLLEQQRLAALGRLAAGVGHEINNPLQYLLFHLEEMRGTLGSEAGPAVSESLQEAIDGARRIGRVVTSLRAYGVQGERVAPVELPQVVQAALRIASPQLRHRVRIETDLHPTPLVLGDEGQLVQMIVNPLVNAAQSLAVLSDGREAIITVRTGTTDDGQAELLIADNGPGFDPAILPSLGEPYVTTRARDGGTGLGLFVTRGLVAAHGGTLSLENLSEGGAAVCIRLPASRETSMEDLVEAPVSTLTVPPSRVLVVDDEPALLAVMQRVLGRMGHTVFTVRDGRAALSLAATEPLDVIVSDLMMPEMSGAELAAALESGHPMLRRRLIVMTGGAVTADDEAFLSREDVVVVNKPVSLQDLGAAMHRVLSRV